MAEYRRENPINEGIDKEELKSRLSEQSRIKDIRRDAASLAELVKRMVIRTQGAYVLGKDFSTMYSQELKSMLEQIGTLYARAGIGAPLTAEAVNRFRDKNRAGRIIADMRKNGRLIKLSLVSYMDSRTYDQVPADLKGYLTVHGEVLLGEFRDLCNTSRKYTIQLLEFMDKKKITRIAGDKQVLIH